jgi:hypothetical protein
MWKRAHTVPSLPCVPFIPFVPLFSLLLAYFSQAISRFTRDSLDQRLTLGPVTVEQRISLESRGIEDQLIPHEVRDSEHRETGLAGSKHLAWPRISRSFSAILNPSFVSSMI